MTPYHDNTGRLVALVAPDGRRHDPAALVALAAASRELLREAEDRHGTLSRVAAAYDVWAAAVRRVEEEHVRP